MAFGICGMSIIYLVVVRTSEMPAPPHLPRLSGLWCTASFDLLWWETPAWPGLRLGIPTNLSSACPDGLTPLCRTCLLLLRRYAAVERRGARILVDHPAPFEQINFHDQFCCCLFSFFYYACQFLDHRIPFLDLCYHLGQLVPQYFDI